MGRKGRTVLNRGVPTDPEGKREGIITRVREPDVDGTGVQQATHAFTDTPVWNLYEKRVRKGQDLVTVVSDHQSRRGTGKTTKSEKIAGSFDRTPEGLVPEKVAISPEEIISAYVNQPKGSGLVLDEAEAGVGSRNAMSAVNKALNKLVSMGRIQEKYLVINAPSSTQIDSQLRELADLWALVQRRGNARWYRFRVNPFDSDIYNEPLCEVEWSDFEDGSRLERTYQELTEEKEAHLEGDDDSFMKTEEVEEKVESAVDEAHKQTRNHLIGELYENSDLTYNDIAAVLPDDEHDCWDISAERVGQIARDQR